MQHHVKIMKHFSTLRDVIKISKCFSERYDLLCFSFLLFLFLFFFIYHNSYRFTESKILKKLLMSPKILSNCAITVFQRLTYIYFVQKYFKISMGKIGQVCECIMNKMKFGNLNHIQLKTF